MKDNKISRRDFLKALGTVTLSVFLRPEHSAFQQVTSGEYPPNVLILVFDALSATNMSLYGYPRRTTPNIKRAASKALVYNNHYSAGNYTPPGTASLLTGTYPWRHRVLQLSGTIDHAIEENNIFMHFNQHYNTIGYTHNAAVNVLLHQLRGHIDHLLSRSELVLSTNFLADKYLENDHIGFSQADTIIFDFPNGPPSSYFLSRFNLAKWHYDHRTLNEQYSDEFPIGVPFFYRMHLTLEQAIDWLKNQAKDQKKPYLAYIHLLPPHYPYITREEFYKKFDDGWLPTTKPESVFSPRDQTATSLAEYRRQYDEAIAYVDAEFGRLFDFMDKSGALDDTYLILTSDHGEMFERGILRHITPTLYQPIIRIPLLIWRPSQNSRKDIHIPTSAVDLMPTILHVTGQSIPDKCEGRILPLFNDQAVDLERSIFAFEAKENPANQPFRKATIAIIKGQFKMIYYFGYEGIPDFYELYDLANDPEELEDISESSPKIANRMLNEIMDKLEEINSG
jgi:arylsulfatase A-like enzyme